MRNKSQPSRKSRWRCPRRSLSLNYVDVYAGICHQTPTQYEPRGWSAGGFPSCIGGENPADPQR